MYVLSLHKIIEIKLGLLTPPPFRLQLQSPSPLYDMNTQCCLFFNISFQQQNYSVVFEIGPNFPALAAKMDGLKVFLHPI